MSEDTVRKKFAEFYPKLKIPKINRFAQCDLCFLFRGKMELAAGEKKLLYRKQLHKHHDHVRQDKAKYYGHRRMAFNRERDEAYCGSMIVDAIPKWKTQVPHLAREPKSLGQQGEQLQFQLTASKIHNMCNVADWQYGGQFAGPGSGCNFSCTILLANLHLIEELKGDIPRHLKLQMDKCAKDNKNSTVLGFCGLLVAEGVVETVEINFLMVGHTHEDIAGLFGVLSKLVNQNAFTTTAMEDLLAQAGRSASSVREREPRSGVGNDNGPLYTRALHNRQWRSRLWQRSFLACGSLLRN
ncbi:hypothetical protein WJX77_008066 [Trebouxia sp. C0004]